MYLLYFEVQYQIEPNCHTYSLNCSSEVTLTVKHQMIRNRVLVGNYDFDLSYFITPVTHSRFFFQSSLKKPLVRSLIHKMCIFAIQKSSFQITLSWLFKIMFCL